MPREKSNFWSEFEEKIDQNGKNDINVNIVVLKKQ
jgi:hypothetical protein